MTDYADINVTSDDWTTVAAATDVVRWQAQGASVRLSTKSAPSGETGTIYAPGEVFDCPAGVAVSYRRAGHPSGKLTREVIS
jgi:uncharacterized protein (DUF2345 family)